MWVTLNARATCKNEGVLVFYDDDNSIITGLIALKLRMHEGIHLATYFYVSQLGCYCTCARSQISRTGEPIALKFGTAMGTG